MRLSILLIFFLVAGCNKASLHNNLGFFDIKMENPIDAEKEFRLALLEDSNHLLARYNLSMTNLRLEKLKDALKELDSLEKTYEANKKFENSAELFHVYFAKAFLLGMINNTPAALETYQKALRIAPDSLEVKNNIEILTKSGSKGGKGGESGEEKDGKGGEEGPGGDKKNKKKGSGKGDSNDDPKGQDDSSLKKKNLSKEEIDQILKEIKNQESRVRAKANKKKGKPGGNNEKTW